METRWTPVFLVSAGGVPRVSEHLTYANFARLTQGAEGFGIAPLGDHACDLVRDGLFFLAFTDGDHALFESLCSEWQARFASARPPRRIDIPKGLSSKDLPKFLLPAALEEIAGLHTRHTTQMRALFALRQSHDALQSAFQKLETLFHEIGRDNRLRDISLPKHPSTPRFTLTETTPVHQRLPLSSAGLSDISLLIDAVDISSNARLEASLELLESGSIVATWSLLSSALRPGWLRLSLPRALDADAQTPVLHLRWHGDGGLCFETSVHHPDPRFRPSDGAPLLALETWKYVPGVQVPASLEGVYPEALGPVTNWHIGPDALRAAAEGEVPIPMLDYLDGYKALAVKPMGYDTTAARLARAGRTGMKHLFGGIKTEQVDGPVVEYAMGLAPANSAGMPPDFADGYVSDWLPLMPGQWSELHLFLPTPLTGDHDLFLMTRLAEGARAETPPRACFYSLTARCDHGV